MKGSFMAVGRLIDENAFIRLPGKGAAIAMTGQSADKTHQQFSMDLDLGSRQAAATLRDSDSGC
jgi:hypothetical protein